MTAILVVGARKGSLGEAVAEQIKVAYGSDATLLTAGTSGEEDVVLDLVDGNVKELLDDYRPDHVVCTAGINHDRRKYRAMDVWWESHMFVNLIGPVRLLEAYTDLTPRLARPYLGHFVAISSNSAAIPRTGSGPYCASKAALSMALRVAAREAAREGMGHVVYGYEPGLLAGTPMTQETEARLPGVPLTRMQGRGLQNGMSAAALAWHIVSNLRHGGPELNGVMLRLDAGEQ